MPRVWFTRFSSSEGLIKAWVPFKVYEERCCPREMASSAVESAGYPMKRRKINGDLHNFSLIKVTPAVRAVRSQTAQQVPRRSSLEFMLPTHFSFLLISELSREKASGISPAPNEHPHSSRRWTNYNFHVVKFHVSRCNLDHVKRPICQSCCEAGRKKTGGSIDVFRISPEQYLSRSPFL